MRLQFLNRTREISKFTRALNSTEPTFTQVFNADDVLAFVK